MSTFKVYFLLKERRPIYIGHTKSLQKRIPNHRDKDYDCVKWFVCKDKETALFYEKRWQSFFKPAHNVNGIIKPKPKSKRVKVDKVAFKRISPKRIQVVFSLEEDEYKRLCRVAKREERSPGNYLSFCVTRGLKNDTFIFDRFMGNRTFINDDL